MNRVLTLDGISENESEIRQVDEAVEHDCDGMRCDAYGHMTSGED